jgi:hypothetical protein
VDVVFGAADHPALGPRTPNRPPQCGVSATRAFANFLEVMFDRRGQVAEPALLAVDSSLSAWAKSASLSLVDPKLGWPAGEHFVSSRKPSKLTGNLCERRETARMASLFLLAPVATTRASVVRYPG